VIGEGALTRVLAYASLTGRPLTPELVRETLHDLTDVDAPIPIASIQRVVADAFGVSVDDLARPCTIQARETTVLAAIYHVVEHFGMHTGQIVLLTKERVPEAIHFYDDSDGAARPLWGGGEGIREI